MHRPELRRVVDVQGVGEVEDTRAGGGIAIPELVVHAGCAGQHDLAVRRLEVEEARGHARGVGRDRWGDAARRDSDAQEAGAEGDLYLAEAQEEEAWRARRARARRELESVVTDADASAGVQRGAGADGVRSARAVADPGAG